MTNLRNTFSDFLHLVYKGTILKAADICKDRYIKDGIISREQSHGIYIKYLTNGTSILLRADLISMFRQLLEDRESEVLWLNTVPEDRIEMAIYYISKLVSYIDRGEGDLLINTLSTIMKDPEMIKEFRTWLSEEHGIDLGYIEINWIKNSIKI